jgi:hypothetical protein
VVIPKEAREKEKLKNETSSFFDEYTDFLLLKQALPTPIDKAFRYSFQKNKANNISCLPLQCKRFKV